MIFSWADTIDRALLICKTPFYLFAWDPVLEALDEVKVLERKLPVRHWLSFKTHPVKPLIERWRAAGHGIEVVSEYELSAALDAGFDVSKILVNGVAKHSWLPRFEIPGLRVHFDSVRETRCLLDQAVKLSWRVGVRVHVREEYDSDEPNFGGQFGLSAAGVASCSSMLRAAGLEIESVHFHLRSNVSSPQSYRNAIEEVANLCKDNGISPQYLDCGGGFPAPNIQDLANSRSSPLFDLSILGEMLDNVRKAIPSVEEIWFENGRFLTARSGVLVVSVLDVKSRPDSRYLICDGGRTNNALVSDWETHRITTLPQKEGLEVLTTICGPTCMAWDRLRRLELPKAIDVGDHIVWHDAGAYHLPWETHFSMGLAAVVWSDDAELSVVRKHETFDEWWGRWMPTKANYGT